MELSREDGDSTGVVVLPLRALAPVDLVGGRPACLVLAAFAGGRAPIPRCHARADPPEMRERLTPTRTPSVASGMAPRGAPWIEGACRSERVSEATCASGASTQRPLAGTDPLDFSSNQSRSTRRRGGLRRRAPNADLSCHRRQPPIDTESFPVTIEKPGASWWVERRPARGARESLLSARPGPRCSVEAKRSFLAGPVCERRANGAELPDRGDSVSPPFMRQNDRNRAGWPEYDLIRRVMTVNRPDIPGFRRVFAPRRARFERAVSEPFRVNDDQSNRRSSPGEGRRPCARARRSARQKPFYGTTPREETSRVRQRVRELPIAFARLRRRPAGGRRPSDVLQRARG